MSERQSRPRGLGRGLSALMADVAPDNDSNLPRRADMRLPVEKLVPNPDQPRRHFPEEAMQDLTASIKEKGVIQPIIVRELPGREGFYEIVAGERRWRASQAAKLHEVPVVLRDYNDIEVLEIAIIENIQRADLSAIDEAAGYRMLMDRFGHTQEQLATALGKSRSHIANLLRLLNLPDDVQKMVTDGVLSAGHARTLVGNAEASTLARKMVSAGLSVREAERLVKEPKLAKAKETAPKTKDADTVQIEQELSATLGMPVTIDHQAGSEGGKLILRYRNLDQLDDLLRALTGG